MSEANRSATNLAQKLAKVMGLVSRVPKNGHNSFHNYDYATEGDVADTVRDALAEVGVAIIPTLMGEVAWREVDTQGGKKERIATVRLKYTITDGATCYESEFVGEGQDRGDKAIYKAYTGAHKYFLLRMFNISTGDDNDPERESDAPPRRQHEHQKPAVHPKPAPAQLSGEEKERLDKIIAEYVAQMAKVQGPSDASALSEILPRIMQEPKYVQEQLRAPYGDAKARTQDSGKKKTKKASPSETTGDLLDVSKQMSDEDAKKAGRVPGAEG